MKTITIIKIVAKIEIIGRIITSISSTLYEFIKSVIAVSENKEYKRCLIIIVNTYCL